jgi:hypothetical protein
MKTKIGALLLGGLLLGGVALLPSVSEGRGGGPGWRGRCGQGQCRQLNENCPQDGQRLKDGACPNENCPQNGPADCPGPGYRAGNRGGRSTTPSK